MQPQSPPGHWYFIPDQPAQPIRDTRLCRNAGEWLLFLADCAAIAIILLVALANQIAAGWRW